MAALENETEGERVITSSMVVDHRSQALLESSSWSDILEALSARYLIVYAKDDPKRPGWLDQKEELSHLALSLSGTSLSAPEMKGIATRLASEHSGNNQDCKEWAKSETKWLLNYLNSASTLMAAFMELPSLLSSDPGPPAPRGHAMAGMSMRVAMVHSAFLVLADSRRVKAIEEVEDQRDDGFIVHVDGSVSKRPNALQERSPTPTDPKMDMEK